MKRFLLSSTFLMLATAAHGQAFQARVVASCNVANLYKTTGASQNVTMDVNGNFCTNATGGGGGGGGAVYGPTAVGSPVANPPVVNGYQDASGNVQVVSPTTGFPVSIVSGSGTTGSVTAAGTNGSVAQAVQGINGGIAVAVTWTGQTVAATQSGTWNVGVTSSVLPTGAATAANQNSTAAGTSATNGQGVQGVTGGVPLTTMPVDGTPYTLNGTAAGPMLGTGANATTGAINTSGFSSMSVQITSAGTGNTVTLQGSDDGVTWYNDSNGYGSTNGGIIGGLATISGLSLNKLPINHLYERLSITTYGSGTVTAVVVMKVTQTAPLGIAVTQQGGNSAVTPWGVQASATANPGGISSTSRFAASAASTNATSAKASAGRLFKVYACNTTMSAKYIRFYNLATAPTVGTSTIAFARTLPPSGTAGTPLCQAFDWYDVGWYFSAGIAYAITGSNADTDTTALAAGDVTMFSAEYQ